LKPAASSSGEKKSKTRQRHGKPGEHEDEYKLEKRFLAEGVLVGSYWLVWDQMW